MELPLFPLHTVLFPGRPLPLHIFEPRYRQLLSDSLAADQRFGVVAIRHGHEVGGGAETFDVGTLAEIESVTELPDGRSDIIARGVQRFRVLGSLDGAPYPRADVELLDEPTPCAQDRLQARRLRELLAPYLTCFGAPKELLARLPEDPNELAYIAAAALQTDLAEQQRILELDVPGERLASTLQVLRREAGLIRRLGAVGSLRPPGPSHQDLN